MGVVEMDTFGDRQMDFAVWDMTDFESGEFQVNSFMMSSTPERKNTSMMLNNSMLNNSLFVCTDFILSNSFQQLSLSFVLELSF